MVERIACFLTCGYTEAGAMQFFLRKINDKYEYKQYLPNKTIKKKGDIKSIDPKISGLTGEKLLEKIYDILEKHREEIGRCKAVLIEDDLDGRFRDYSDERIEEYKNQIILKVREKLQKNVPVFILYASPEAESWFIADWKNGFEYLYGYSGIVTDVEYHAKLFFLHQLKWYVERNVLKEYSENIEEYGWFEGKYIKLSDQIIYAIQAGIKEYLRKEQNGNVLYIKQITESRDYRC